MASFAAHCCAHGKFAAGNPHHPFRRFARRLILVRGRGRKILGTAEGRLTYYEAGKDTEDETDTPHYRNLTEETKIAARRVPVVTIFGVSTPRHGSYAGWFPSGYSHLRSFMLKGPAGKSGELFPFSLLARARLGPTRNDGSHISDKR